MSLEDIRTGKQVLDGETVATPITANLPIAAEVRGALLSQIAQAGRRNGLVELAHALVDPVNPDQWLEEQLRVMQPQQLLPELIAMLRMFERISQSIKKRVAWFRSRMEGAVDQKELRTTVEHRIDHFLTDWIERLEDEDFGRLLTELENAEGLPIADRAQLAERCYRDLCDLVRRREIYKEDWESSRYREEGVKRERLIPEQLDDLRWGTDLREKRIRSGREVWRSHS